ncbi:hypothetical protein CIG75_12730 [Tumebacillus algifaecis]|uniref:IraD/Gp25-like domain-containing protein n=1 Tax=Tumebacillus algifaecis TaxID=1214604 RepID=A0A223D2Z4_9BACL|nr:DUF2634 domain-containing protein [Tumebacillus algifaecis]ASS75764.1 hypothetical protein CIG75_12730 [Tumebacillus algifaecis]
MSAGTDIFYDPTAKDVQWLGLDLVTISGAENYRQQMILRLLTDRGELIHYPDYGTSLFHLARLSMSPARLEELQRELVQTCQQDTRTQQVDQVEIVNENGCLRISACLHAIEREFRLEMIIGDQVEVNVL